MSENQLKISVSDSLYVYGVYAQVESRSVIIFVHGIPGSSEDDLLVEASHYFQREGFATYRASLYSPHKDARQMKDCTIKINAHDIKSVVAHFKAQGYDLIHIIGHSFGCVPLLSEPIPDCASLNYWDPTYRFSFLDTDTDALPPTCITENDCYILNWGANLVLGKNVVVEAEEMDWDTLGRHVTPVFIAYAEHGVLKEGAERYFKNAQGKKSLVMIKGADHRFSASAAVRKSLFTETGKWLKDL